MRLPCHVVRFRQCVAIYNEYLLQAYYGNEADEDAEDGELQIDESRMDDEEEEIPEPRDHAADLKAILQRAE